MNQSRNPSGRGPRCCVIGHPVNQSRSPLIHGYWLEKHGLAGSYERLDVAPEALPDFVGMMRNGLFAGANVTVPHKQDIIPLLDSLTEAATAIGAVNTVYREGDRLVGENSDVTGFLAHLDASAAGWDRNCQAALVLGAGGAARGIIHGLLSRGITQVHVANRDPARAEALARAFGPRVMPLGWDLRNDAVAGADLIANATSLGMKGQPRLELDLRRLRPGCIVDDIVYVPLETDLLRMARDRGAVTVDGLGMLLHQAVAGFTRWFGIVPQVTPELRALVQRDVEAAP